MRRYSVLTAFATAEFFGYNAAPTVPAVANLTNQIVAPAPGMGAPMMAYNSSSPAGLSSAPVILVQSSTLASAGPPVLTQVPGATMAGAVFGGSTTGVALTGTPSSVMSATAGVNNTIPEEAAGGLGKYLNQIAAELSAELTARTDTNTTTTVPAQGPSMQAVPQQSLRNGLNYRSVALADAPPVAPVAPSSMPLATYPVIGSASGSTIGNGTGTDNVPLEKRSAESTLSTAAAAGGLLVLGAGACGLYAKNRSENRAELSRFGSPYRRGGNEPPRRFTPV